MKEAGIVDIAFENLENETGMKAEWLKQDTMPVDGELYLLINENLKKHFFIEVKKEVRAHHVTAIEDMAKVHQPLLLVAQTIPPGVKTILREKKIAYLDAAGNIFIDTKDIFIRIEGNKFTPLAKGGNNRAFTKTGLKVVFHFLLYPDQVNTTYQEIAGATGTAIGNVKNVLDGLKNAGFLLQLDKKKMQLVNTRTLFDRWLTGYAEILKPNLLIGKYKMINPDARENWEQLPMENQQTFWGGEPAAAMLTNQLRPEILTVYTDDTAYPFMAKWKMIPKENGDICIYKKFWKEYPLFGAVTAPPLLVYADLLLTNDPRNLELAQVIKQQHLPDEY